MWITLVSGVIGRIIFGAVGFLHANIKNGESFDYERFGKQVLIALIISVISVISGQSTSVIGDAAIITMLSLMVEKTWNAIKYK